MTEDPPNAPLGPVADPSILDLVRRLNADPSTRAVVYAAGGGSALFPWLLALGGGSATLLSGRIPYAREDFLEILGHDPGKLVSPRAARGLAMVAFRQALRLKGPLPADRVFGLASTAKLSTGEHERPGRVHEIHLALQSASSTLSRSIAVPPGTSRAWQEDLNARALLDLLAMAKGLPRSVPIDPDGGSLAEGVVVDESTDAAGCGHPGLVDLVAGVVPWVAFDLPDRGPVASSRVESPRLILPGSFRPFHEGHARMALMASRIVGEPCDFELSVFHPEKPPLSYLAIRQRLGGFGPGPGRLVVTDAPTYVEKARLFPGATFVVGHDTAVRLLDPRWYGQSPSARDAMLDELEALGARFLVFGRVDDLGRFRVNPTETLDDPRVVRFIADRARSIPEGDFRLDLSSTELRARSPVDFA